MTDAKTESQLLTMEKSIPVTTASLTRTQRMLNTPETHLKAVPGTMKE